MKRLLYLGFVLVLALGACARQSKGVLDFDSATQEISAAYGEKEGFVRADEDFVLTNFGAPDYVTDSAVFLSDTGEIGIFALSDAKHAPKMQKTIEEYLTLERESVVSLAELYPADELSARLARFDSARVGAVGSTVYYYMLDANAATAVEKLFRK